MSGFPSERVAGSRRSRWLIWSEYADITERKACERQLQFQAHYDPLTRLPNRTLLLDRLEHSLHQARRRNRNVAVMYFDLDRFKLINDSLGHDMGDNLLRIVAARLESCVRQEDTVARLGGDEFVIVLENLNHDDLALSVGHKALAVLQTPVTLQGHEYFINTSIGTSLFPQDAQNAQGLLKCADIALHRAKAQGRGTIQCYAPALQEHAARRQTLHHDLRHALPDGQLALHYQPQVRFDSGEIVGVQVGLWWRHPRLGLITASECLPLMEESGLILPIGEWLLEQAASQVRAWQQTERLGLSLAMRVSMRQFIQRRLPEQIATLLAETGLDAADLELEITEPLLIQDISSALETPHALKALGMRLTLADFGNGHCSLRDLKRCPLDRIKLPAAFVQGVAYDDQAATLVSALIALAHRLGLEVIAEGVTTAGQYQYLHQERCDVYQGTYFSAPDAGTDLTQQLQVFSTKL